ncbi:hypothetical protein HPB49_020241 [Dermacentor silvarum]|uniref:Uncharacterized protein n=1 Tax=Dermacentor silvarum TaxID=543639 RepID=A0ACB8CH79_DERSI|nr:hypothetical protein HPB49_020241 [Dermacentor silvarum]
MVGASKNHRKSALRVPSPRPRERRVSFAVPNAEEITTHVTGRSTASVLQPATEGPLAAPYPYGGGSAHWTQHSPYYGSVGALTHSSTPASFESPLPVMTGPFTEKTAKVRGSYRARLPLDSRGSQIFRPFSQLKATPERPRYDDDQPSALPTLRNVAVAALTAAVLAVVIAVALAVQLSAPIIETGTSEMSHVVEKLHSGDIRIAAPLPPIKAPVRTMPSVTVRHRTRASRTHRITDHRRLLPTASPRTMTASTATRHVTRTATSTRRHSRNQSLPHQCGRHFYAYCTASVSEVYYSASSHACLSTEEDSVQLCNHGTNRFSSLGNCLTSCVHADNGEPHDRCYESVLFTTCTRQDVSETWWYYNGSACTEWNFPLGHCPSLGRRVYRSRKECDRTCRLRQQHGNTTASRHRRCDLPVATMCTAQQIKYPYFADMRARGSARCVKASSHTLRVRRCLIGSNRFDSVASCEQSCVHL